MMLVFITKIKENKIFEKKSRKIKVLKDFEIKLIVSL
tara:strand:+ start:1323 stop:1433 length:111 start_codon:yes stop_codon:yes gene_type:complete